MALDPSIVLLIGADTAIVDESSYARTLTVSGGPTRTTAQAKYGAGSLNFTGAGYVSADNSADWDFGTAPFTIEGWYRFLSRTTDQALVGQWTNNAWFFLVGSASDGLIFLNGGAPDVKVPFTPTLGQWYHLAVDRIGTTIRLYVNGAVVATNTSYTAAIKPGTSILQLGAVWGFSSLDFNGQMDEVRITKGIAHYQGAFTPPSGPFPRDSVVAVPNVVGLTQSAATTAITTAGLTLGTVTPASSTTVAAGLVISQAPAAGASVAPASAVAITVSSGPPLVTVPNVVGMMESAAQSALTAAGLTLAPHTQAPSAAPVGQVLAQSPAAGASVALGTAVQLQISRGAKAWTSARSGIARSGATRSNYVFPDVPGVVVIGGVDYTAKILNGSLQVHLEINDKPDTCSFQVFVGDAATQAAIVVGADVVVGLTSPAASNPIFGGQMVQVQTTRNPASIDSLASVMCADYLQIVDSQILITYDWPAQSATTTILDLVARFANKPGGVTISTAGVQPGLPSHQAFGVINERFSTVLRRMVTMFPTPGGFYIDAGKVLRVWTGKPEPGHTQPTAFTLANPHLKQFADLVDGTPVRDAVIVEGRRTTAPIGVVPHPTVPDRLRDFPVVDASILDRVHDQPGREIRVGTQRAIVRYAYGVWSSPAGTPQSTVTTADVAFNPVQPPTTINIPVASVTMFLGRLFNSWVKVDEQYLIVTSAPGPHIVVVTSGWGGMTGPIKAGAAVSMIDSFVEVTLTGRYDAPGSPEVPRAQGRDTDVVMVVRSSTPPGIHEQLVQDGRYVISGATNRGQHEIADFALPAKSIQFETTDTNALPGRVQSYSFVEPPLVTSAGDYMILTTDITWPVWGELPLRTCTAANIGAADIVDAWLVDPR